MSTEVPVYIYNCFKGTHKIFKLVGSVRRLDSSSLSQPPRRRLERRIQASLRTAPQPQNGRPLVGGGVLISNMWTDQSESVGGTRGRAAQSARAWRGGGEFEGRSCESCLGLVPGASQSFFAMEGGGRGLAQLAVQQELRARYGIKVKRRPGKEKESTVARSRPGAVSRVEAARGSLLPLLAQGGAGLG